MGVFAKDGMGVHVTQTTPDRYVEIAKGNFSEGKSMKTTCTMSNSC
jgi:hypothetical protein